MLRRDGAARKIRPASNTRIIGYWELYYGAGSSFWSCCSWFISHRRYQSRIQEGIARSSQQGSCSFLYRSQHTSHFPDSKSGEKLCRFRKKRKVRELCQCFSVWDCCSWNGLLYSMYLFIHVYTCLYLVIPVYACLYTCLYTVYQGVTYLVRWTRCAGVRVSITERVSGAFLATVLVSVSPCWTAGTYGGAFTRGTA